MKLYIRVRGEWQYLYRAFDRDGTLVDVMLSDHRDLAAAKAFFPSSEMVIGVNPARVATDGHDAYPRAIRTELGCQARHRTSCYLNNRLEQDHHGIRPMSTDAGTEEHRVSGALLPMPRRVAQLPAATRRWQHMWKTAIGQNGFAEGAGIEVEWTGECIFRMAGKVARRNFNERRPPCRHYVRG